MPKKKPSKKLVTRLVEYMLTGGAWFWSGFALFALLYSVFKWPVIPAKITAYIFGLLVNFILERFWVFGDKHPKSELNKVTLRYLLLSALNLVIDTGIVYGLNEIGINPYIGQFISAGFFTVWNFVWYKAWVFAKKSKPGPKRAASPTLHRPKHVRHPKKRVQR